MNFKKISLLILLVFLIGCKQLEEPQKKIIKTEPEIIKEKITSTPISTQNLDNDKLDFSYDDIYTALSSLGYKKSQIDKAVKKLNDEGSYEGDIENVIKRILAIIR